MSIPVMIIPVLNRFDLLEKSLASIDYPVDEILILNNSGDDNNTLGMQEKFQNLKLRILNLPSNLGTCGSWNLGIKLYPFSPYWVISSADTSFISDSLEKLANESDRWSLVKSNASYSCFSLGEYIVENVGLFDEFIYPAYYEDNDYEDRIILAGLADNIKLPGIDVDDSGGSQTIKSEPRYNQRNGETFNRNGQYYFNKKNTGDYSIKGWNLTRRRENDWTR